MIPDVEEFGPEFEAIPLIDREVLEEGQVPVLETWAANNIPSGVSKGSQHCVGCKGARVEERSGNARLAIRIANAIWPNTIGHSATAVGVREVGRNVCGGEVVPGRCGDNASNFPPSNYLI